MRNFYFKHNARVHHISGGSGIFRSDPNPHIWRTLDECELFIVTSGVVYIRQGEDSYELRRGDYLVTERNIEYGGDKPMSGTFHWAHFNYEEDDAFFADSDEAYSAEEYFSFPKSGHLRNTGSVAVLAVLLEQYGMDGTKRLVTDALLYALLLDICDSVSGRAAPRSKDKRFQPIMEYFHVNSYLGDFHNVKGMAEFFGYNERYLTRLFKKNTGKTPHEYIIEKKMARAREMLADTDMTIKSIAGTLQFDYYYFLKLFRKTTGMSPTEFRKNIIPNWKCYLPPDDEE